jgi:hypothetical protein
VQIDGRFSLLDTPVGDITTIPMGLQHFVSNPSCAYATYFSVFDSRDPGTSFLINALLEAPKHVLATLFGVKYTTIKELTAAQDAAGPFGLPLIIQDTGCAKRCNA